MKPFFLIGALPLSLMLAGCFGPERYEGRYSGSSRYYETDRSSDDYRSRSSRSRRYHDEGRDDDWDD